MARRDRGSVSIVDRVTLALKETSTVVNRALIAQFRPWELLPPAEWADPARCAHPGPYTTYRTDVWHCNQCGHPVTPAPRSHVPLTRP
jgi:hypothetical protein